jgi:O-antigen ligase
MVAASASVRLEQAQIATRLPAVLLGLSVVPVLAANGGYFPTTWGWAAMGLAAAGAVAAAVRAPSRPSLPEIVFALGLALFAVWLAVSSLWTEAPTQTPLQVERGLVYVAAAVAVVGLARRRYVPLLLGGICAALTIVCAYALATRLFPDVFGLPTGYGGLRLSTPIGYWNGLGLVAAMGLLLALPIAARGTRRASRGLAAATLPLLAPTLYFTFSRGAWLALALGLAALFAVDRRRLQLLAVGAPLGALSAVVVYEASRSAGLTHTGFSVSGAAHDGHRLAGIVFAACLVAAYAAVAFRSLERSVKVPRRVRHAAGWAVVAVLAVALTAVFVRAGSPVTLAHRAYHSVESNPPATHGNLNNRLFSLSSNGRLAQWRVAVHMFERAPLIGLGAGSYEQEWYLHRPGTWKVRDAHSLYLQTMGESGIVGLLLLCAALLTPILVFPRVRRREPLAAGALAAYVAFLAHSAVDWDWQLSGVTVSALLCGGALLAAGRSESRAGRWRSVPIVLGTVVIIASFVGLAGNLALAASENAARVGNWNKASSAAQRAKFWAPWSATPYVDIAAADRGLGAPLQAIGNYEIAAQKTPDDWRLWLALAQASSGRTRAHALAQVRRLNPLDPTGAGD